MLQNLQNFAKFQKFQLDNLVDFEKCCKTRIFLLKSVPIQPKTSNICRNLPKTSNYPTSPPGRRRCPWGSWATRRSPFSLRRPVGRIFSDEQIRLNVSGMKQIRWWSRRSPRRSLPHRWAAAPTLRRTRAAPQPCLCPGLCRAAAFIGKN